MPIQLPALMGSKEYTSEKKSGDGFDTGVLNLEVFVVGCQSSVVMVKTC